jgi:hypothetical protein
MKELTNISFLSFYLCFNQGHCFLHVQYPRNVTYIFFYNYFSRLRWKKDRLCMNEHCNRWEIKRHALRLLFSLLLLIIFWNSTFTYFSLTSIVLDHYLMVTTITLFVFSLYYLNDSFSYQNSVQNWSSFSDSNQGWTLVPIIVPFLVEKLIATCFFLRIIS